MYLCLLSLAALIVTGGRADDGQPPAEVILPTGQSCSLPKREREDEGHTQSGFTACGGWHSIRNCYTFNGEWEQSHVLTLERGGHVAWQSPAGILLLGGHTSNSYTTGDIPSNSLQTSELLSGTSSTSTAAFNLPYESL